MTRRLLLLFAGLWVLCSGVVAALATRQNQSEALRGYENPLTAPALPYRVPLRGVNVALEQYTLDELDVQFQQMVEADITWVRQPVDWATLEAEQGGYDWSQWDQWVAAKRPYETLQWVVTFVNTPSWARNPRALDSITAPPADPAHFAEFVAAFTQRYGQAIDVYQIWDEPNLQAAWGGLEPRVTDYAALLEAGYGAVHSHDASATVITAGFAPTQQTGPLNINEWDYLAALYTLGADDFFDAVAAKLYGFDLPPSDRQVDLERLNFSRVVRLREIMVANGDADKAIWASQWGWNSLPENWQGANSVWGQVTAEQQSDYTLSALARAEREWPWMAGMILTHWQPNVPTDDPQWGFALVNPDGQASPLLQGLQTHAPLALPQNGLYPPDSPYAEYTGVWTFGTLGADIGWINDSHLQFRFYGSQVGLLLRQGDYVGYLYPRVDDSPLGALPRDAAGNPYIVLTSETLDTAVLPVTVAERLPLAEHQLTLTADRGWDQWALVGYLVSAGDLNAPYVQQIGLAWATAFVGLFATGIALRGFPLGVWWSTLVNLLKPLQFAGQFALGVVASLLLLLGVALSLGDSLPTIFRRDSVSLPLALLTAGFIYLAPSFLLALAAALVLFVVIYHRLEVGLMLVILWAPFFLFPVELYLRFFPMAEITLLLCVAAWGLKGLVSWARRYRGQTSNSPLLPPLRLTASDYIVLAYGLLACLSLVWTRYHDPAITELRVMVIEPMLFYAMFRTTIRGELAIRRFVQTFVITGLVVAVVSLGLYWGGEGIIRAEGDAPRMAGIYGSPNNLALFLGRVIPFAFAALFLQQRRWQGLALLALGVLIPVFGLTLSVGGIFIGLPLALGGVLLLQLRRRAILPLIGLVLVGGLLFVVLLQYPRFARVLDFSSGTNFFRVRVWQSAAYAIADHPLTGLGLDQFLYAFRGTYILPDAWQEPNLSHPHNLILDFWTRLGVGGVLIFLAWQITFWRLWLRLYRQQLQTFHWMLIGAAGAMFYLLGHGLVDNSVFVVDLVLVFMMLLALPQQIQNAREYSAVS